MKSLRSQLILSHVLPQLIVLPLLAIILAYIIESQFLLAELADDFKRVAMLAAQNAAVHPEIWQDASQADDFTRSFSDTQQREIFLLRPNGSIHSSPSNASGSISSLSSEDLSTLLSGKTLVKRSYSITLENIHVEALAPVLDTRQAIVGIVRITDRLGNVYDNFRKIRRLEIVATLFSVIVSVLLGAWLARRMVVRLQAITAAVEQVARVNQGAAGQSYPQERMPVDFARVFAAVQDLSNRLRVSEEGRKRLLANLVHEVARPLGALQAAVRALQRGAVENPELRNDILKGMDDQIERLRPLLDNLASLYGLSGQTVELQTAQVLLGDWLREILIGWQAAAIAKNLEWQCEIPDSLPVISMDANRMGQVIGNLVANAIKYTPEGGHIRISAGSEDNQAWISVEDTGIGITPEERQRIFEPFYRGQRARRFPQGMGLGLSIANDIVHLHGGDLQVISEAGCGSRFTLYLPIHHPATQGSVL